MKHDSRALRYRQAADAYAWRTFALDPGEIPDEFLEAAREAGESAEDAADRFGQKYDLDRAEDWTLPQAIKTLSRF